MTMIMKTNVNNIVDEITIAGNYVKMLKKYALRYCGYAVLRWICPTLRGCVMYARRYICSFCVYIYAHSLSYSVRLYMIRL